MSQYVGKTISLVDTKQVRYVGVLASISVETSSLILRNVINYGTESRTKAPKVVAASNEKITEMAFKGSDVSDLYVLENTEEPAASAPAEQTKNDSEHLDFYTQTRQFSQSDRQEIKADVIYNKSASFFDNLSKPYDFANDRSVNHNKLNITTFGESVSLTPVPHRWDTHRRSYRRNGRSQEDSNKGDSKDNDVRGDRGEPKKYHRRPRVPRKDQSMQAQSPGNVPRKPTASSDKKSE